NHGDGHRQNEHEALARTLQVLKLAAPHHLIPFRQLDRRLEASLGFGDKPALITAADVHADGDLSLILSSRNNTGAIDDFNIRQLGKGNASAIRCCYQDIAEVSRVFACLWEVAQRNIKPSLSFKHRADRPASDGKFNDILYLLDFETISRRPLPVDANPELGLVFLLLNGDIRGAAHG